MEFNYFSTKKTSTSSLSFVMNVLWLAGYAIFSVLRNGSVLN